MITLDKTDVSFVSDTLTHCMAVLRLRMTDQNVCEENRDMAMEFHKMAVKARDIVNGRCKKGATDEGR